MMKDWACIFDWDGTIVHTTDLHVVAWHAYAQRIGRSIPPIANLGNCGLTSESVIRDLLAWSDRPEEIVRHSRDKEAVFRELVSEQGLAPQPGVIEFLDRLRALDVPCAIGSSAPHPNIACGLERLGLADRFEVVVSGDDVKCGKPAPDIFLTAARRLETPPARCIVFEDAPAGVEAARRAGMRSIALAFTHPPEALAQADLVVRAYSELDAHRLDALLLDATRPQ